MPNRSPEHPNADVRTRGFVARISVDEALAWLDGELAKLGTFSEEIVSLEESVGRVLAGNVVSQVDVPSFRRAMMDGYALRAEDIARAGHGDPVALEVLGECFPGAEFEGEVVAGQAVRIMTGSPLPRGVDSVLPFEHTDSTGNHVLACQSVAAGKNLGSIGEDIRRGDTILAAGRVVRPQDVGVMSSIGHCKVTVVRRPRVRIVVTGDEVLPVGSQPRGCQIVDANGPMLSALVTRDGGIARHPGVVADDRDEILAALQDDADVILTSGGSSVGQEDHVPTLLAEHGRLAVHGVAMRPAAPVGMGVMDGKLVILLPGNPVACLWGYDLLAGRAIRRLGGRGIDWPYRSIVVPLANEMISPVGRLDYLRVQIIDDKAQPVARRGASVLSSTTQADGFIVVPADVTRLAAASDVEVFLYD